MEDKRTFICREELQNHIAKCVDTRRVEIVTFFAICYMCAYRNNIRMFIAVFLMIKQWKQLKYPSVRRWANCGTYIHWKEWARSLSRSTRKNKKLFFEWKKGTEEQLVRLILFIYFSNLYNITYFWWVHMFVEILARYIHLTYQWLFLESGKVGSNSKW